MGTVQHVLHLQPDPGAGHGTARECPGLQPADGDDGKFLTMFNLSLVMQQVSIIGILAAAQSLIILTAGIDLSVGALMIFSAVIMGFWP